VHVRLVRLSAPPFQLAVSLGHTGGEDKTVVIQSIFCFKRSKAATDLPKGHGRTFVSDIKARSAALVARFEALPFSCWHLKLAILAGIGVLFDAVNLALFGRSVAPVCA
jgi:hypothetical protein